LNGGSQTISVIPVDSLSRSAQINLGMTGGRPLDIAALGRTALVAGGTADVLLVVDLVSSQVLRSIGLPAGSGAASVTIISSEVAYVTNPFLNTVTRIHYRSGDTASVAVGSHPVAAVFTRGRLFVVNAGLEPCPETQLCSTGPSWLTVIDPIANAPAPGRDSIPLPDLGNAVAATVGGDGLIYVLTATGDSDNPGRLIIVDPVTREEIGSFAGFGSDPGRIASDGGERLLITSVTDGLMEFNTRTRQVVRGAGDGIPVETNVAVAIDAEGRIYAVQAGSCTPDLPGRLRVFRPNLTETRLLALGICSTAATVVQVPIIPQVIAE
jgi:hypothetical protein